MKNCERCGTEFEPPRSYKKKRFCSRKCWLTYYNTTDRDHSLKGAQASAKMPHGRGEGGADWYVKEGGQHQHRTIAEQLLGRDLQDGEIVHHKDRDKKNNEPDNLIVFKTQSDHIRHHNRCLERQHICICDCIRLGGDAR